MGRLSVVVPDDLEDRLRQYLYRKHGLKYRGKMGALIAEALTLYLDKAEAEEEVEKEA